MSANLNRLVRPAKSIYAKLLKAGQAIADQNVWRKEYLRNAGAELSLVQHLGHWRRGFLPASERLYDASSFPPGSYLSDFSRYVQTAKINGRYNVVLDDKRVYHRMMAAWSTHVPDLWGTVENGTYYPAGDRTALGLRERLAEADPGGGLVIKPALGGRGKRVQIIRVNVHRDIEWNGAPCALDDVEARVGALRGGVYIVTELVPQAGYAASIYPHTTNTIRVLLMEDADRGEWFVARALHRFGSRASGVVDNFSAGGVCAAVDVATGVMGRAAQKDGRGGVIWHTAHPDTGGQIEHATVPGWQAVVQKLISINEELPFLKYVGWDVLVTDQPGRSGFVLIEGNAMSDVDLLQVHEPLLTDERIRRFYAAHGVI